MIIPENEIHLWFSYDEEINNTILLEKYQDILSAEEIATQKRFHFKKHRHQYLITRAMVRSVLSLYIESVPPEGWKFGRNNYGKPYVSNSPLPVDLKFNLSHTEKMVALAVTAGNNVGIDAEHLLRRRDDLGIAKNYFSEIEFQNLFSLPAQHQNQRFFDLWTLKEAYIKACGMGLSTPLNRFTFSFSKPGEVQIHFSPEQNDNPQHWRLWQVKPGETHMVGLAIHNASNIDSYHLSMRAIIPLENIEEVNYPIMTQSHPLT